MLTIITTRARSTTGGYVFTLSTTQGVEGYLMMGSHPARSGWGNPPPPPTQHRLYLDRLCRWRYASCGFPQEDFLVIMIFADVGMVYDTMGCQFCGLLLWLVLPFRQKVMQASGINDFSMKDVVAPCKYYRTSEHLIQLSFGFLLL